MKKPVRRCYSCGSEWDDERARPGFRDICENCGAYLHCCLNCELHDPTAHNQCRSSTTEPVRERDKVNYCDEFVFREDQPGQSTVPKQEGIDNEWEDFLKKNR